MTTFDAPAPAAPLPLRRAQPFFIQIPSAIWFLGRDRDYWRLMIRGVALLAVTLGIYRFWLTTDPVSLPGSRCPLFACFYHVSGPHLHHADAGRNHGRIGLGPTHARR